jgi:flagellar hook protein FlgE
MGLASALTTALTGMSAAETQIDVAGNNLANSQTVGFKESQAVFANQFLQTQSLGSAPTEGSGGTNPRQVGLGVRTAEITPNFTQGTIEISSNPSDLAIQGDGFFMVESAEGERLYTRNGIFKTNADNELVAITGQRVLGYGAGAAHDSAGHRGGGPGDGKCLSAGSSFARRRRRHHRPSRRKRHSRRLDRRPARRLG